MAYCNIEKFMWNPMPTASSKAGTTWQYSPSLPKTQPFTSEGRDWG